MAFPDPVTVRPEDIEPGTLNPDVTAQTVETLNPATGQRVTVHDGIVELSTGDGQESSPAVIQPEATIPGDTLTMDIQGPGAQGGRSSTIRWISKAFNLIGNLDLITDALGFSAATVSMSPALEIATDETWHNLPLAGTWAAFGGITPRHRKDISGNVFLTGIATGGTAGTIGTLPVGSRPTQQLDYAVKSNNDASSVSWVRIATNGVVSAIGNVPAAQVWCALNVSFSTR